MTRQRLFLLLSLLGDHKWFESWDQDWDWLSEKGYIYFDPDKPPHLTDKGERAILFAVVKAGEV